MGKPASITRAVRVEIAKPIERLSGRKRLPDEVCSWDELGKELRLYRSVMHRLYNAAIFGTAAELEVNEEFHELDGKSRPYQMIRKTVADLKAWGEEKKNEFALLDPCGKLMSMTANTAVNKVAKWVKDKKRDRIPSFKHGAPIPVHNSNLEIFERDDSVLIHIKVTSKGSWVVRTTASKSSQWAGIRELLRKDVKIGCGTINYDERRKKWYVIVPYTCAAPEPTELDDKNVLFIHRGCRNWITALSTNGHYKVVSRGNKYLSQRMKLKQRERSARSISADAERGAGAKGHGRRRRYANSDVIKDKIARINKTTCQQLASKVVKLAKAWGCGRVVIEDYGGVQPDEERGVRRFVERFPLYQLKEAIAWALRKEGIVLGQEPSDYISSKCPRCGQLDSRAHNHRTGVFHCKACGMERPADFVAVYNMMLESDYPSPIWDKKFKSEKKLTDALRAT